MDEIKIIQDGDVAAIEIGDATGLLGICLQPDGSLTVTVAGADRNQFDFEIPAGSIGDCALGHVGLRRVKK